MDDDATYDFDFDYSQEIPKELEDQSNKKSTPNKSNVKAEGKINNELQNESKSIENEHQSNEALTQIYLDGCKEIENIEISELMQEIAQKSDILFLSQEDNENEFNEILSNEFSQYSPDEGIILAQDDRIYTQDDQHSIIGLIEERKLGEESIQKDHDSGMPSGMIKRQMEERMFHFTTDKAGMSEIDRGKVNQKVIEQSKGSEYYQRQLIGLQKMEERVKQMNCKLGIMKNNIQYYDNKHIEANKHIERLEKVRSLERTWIHVDMDMFFAAVEIRDRPELADKPVAVGGEMMISTANYIARKFGVRSAMPGFIAKTLCPELLFVQSNFHKYSAVSKEVMDILADYDPQLESMGCDEANLDLTQYLIQNSLFTDEEKKSVGEEMRKRIFEKTKLTASCGIACNKMLAKICSDFNKPDGLTYLPSDSDDIKLFMSKLSVRKIPGIGKVTEQMLVGLQINTCMDILKRSTDLFILLDTTNFLFYIQSALGIGRNVHEDIDPNYHQKSISVSETYSPPITQYPEFIDNLERLCEELAERVSKKDLAGKNFGIEVKSSTYEKKQKSMNIGYYIYSKEDFLKYAKQLLDQVWPADKTRLLGVRLSNIERRENLSKKHQDTTIVNYLVKEPAVPAEAQFTRELQKVGTDKPYSTKKIPTPDKNKRKYEDIKKMFKTIEEKTTSKENINEGANNMTNMESPDSDKIRVNLLKERSKKGIGKRKASKSLQRGKNKRRKKSTERNEKNVNIMNYFKKSEG